MQLQARGARDSSTASILEKRSKLQAEQKKEEKAMEDLRPRGTHQRLDRAREEDKRKMEGVDELSNRYRRFHLQSRRDQNVSRAEERR